MTIRGFVVATKCQSVAEFVELYHSRCDDTSIFVGIVEPRVKGTVCAFAILLANKQPVFAGVCEVLEVHTSDDNPHGRRGMKLGIRKLGVTSESIFAEMAAMRMANRRFARGSTAPPDNVPIASPHDDGIPDIEVDMSDSEMPAIDAIVRDLEAEDAIPVDIDDDSFWSR